MDTEVTKNESTTIISMPNNTATALMVLLGKTSITEDMDVLRNAIERGHVDDVPVQQSCASIMELYAKLSNELAR